MRPFFWYVWFIAILIGCNEKQQTISFPPYFPQQNRIFFDSVRSETIALGERLFFEPRLSRNDKISCASCHLPELAFTDGQKISRGFEGRFSKHNSSTLLNVGFLSSFMFDLGSHNIEIQPIIPLFDTNEMNMTMPDLEEKFKYDTFYQNLSRKVYGRPLNRRTITWALAAYMKSLIAATSRYDSFLGSGDSSILSYEEHLGRRLFFGRAGCNACHTAPLFTDSKHHSLAIEHPHKGRPGVFANTLHAIDWGRFKTPSLRNIAITAPYFHDGRVANLEEAIHYHLAPERATMDYKPVRLNSEEVKALSAFLNTLTDKRYLGLAD